MRYSICSKRIAFALTYCLFSWFDDEFHIISTIFIIYCFFTFVFLSIFGILLTSTLFWFFSIQQKIRTVVNKSLSRRESHFPDYFLTISLNRRAKFIISTFSHQQWRFNRFSKQFDLCSVCFFQHWNCENFFSEFRFERSILFVKLTKFSFKNWFNLKVFSFTIYF